MSDRPLEDVLRDLREEQLPETWEWLLESGFVPGSPQEIELGLKCAKETAAQAVAQALAAEFAQIRVTVRNRTGDLNHEGRALTAAELEATGPYVIRSVITLNLTFEEASESVERALRIGAEHGAVMSHFGCFLDRDRELVRPDEPIVADLRAAGVRLESLAELADRAKAPKAAVPVLLAHLESGRYPDRVMESLARALAGTATPAVWDALRARFAVAVGRRERIGLAFALGSSASRDRIGELIALLRTEPRGEVGWHLLFGVVRLDQTYGGGAFEKLRTDPFLGAQIDALLDLEIEDPSELPG